MLRCHIEILLRILPLDKGVSHDHIIHCTDTSIEVPYICNLLNITL